MFTITRNCLPAVALAAILAGCGAPNWKQFDQIRVGQALPISLPGKMEHTPLGAGYIGAPGGEGSFFSSDMRIVGAITDSSDSVVARSCLSVALSNNILYVQTKYRYVIEADTGVQAQSNSKAREALKLVASASQSIAARPTEQQIETGGDQRLLSSSLGQIAHCVSMMQEALLETRVQPSSSDISQMQNERYAGTSVRFSRAPNQSLWVKMAAQRVKERLARLPGDAGGQRGRAFVPSGLPEEMLYNHILLNTLSRPSRADNLAQTQKVHAMYEQYAHRNVLEVLGDSETYRGAHADNFDKQWRTLGGTTVRVTRIGGALRVEISGLIVGDSMMTESDMSNVGRSSLRSHSESP
ncbi:MAG: hypothetical protein QGG25_09270 [Phycisphaerae bacterium]|nr:hypothetical protein [Phycisphaerae bacterium]